MNTVWYATTYTVTCDVTVNSGVTLTVMPGANVRFNSQTGLTVNGSLVATGLSYLPIVFTANSASPTPGYWKGITIGSSSVNSRLEYVNVTYGGYGGNGNVRWSSSSLEVMSSTIAFSSGRGLYATGIITGALTNNTFTSNGDYAAYLDFNNGHFDASNGNAGSANTKGVILLNGTLTGINVLAANPTLPYSTDNSLTVNSGASLTLQPGVVFKPVPSASVLSVLFVNGTLIANGTADSPVVFTSFKDDTYGGDTNSDGSASVPVAGDWYAIVVDGGTLSLDHAIVQYGGGGDSAPCPWTPGGMITQVYYQGAPCGWSYPYSAQINITNSTLRYSARPGVQLSGATGVAGNITIQNSIISNNTGDGLQVAGSFTTTISGSSFLSNTGSGIAVNHGQPVSITNNILSDNGSYAASLAVSGQPVALSGNTGTNNHYHAIQFTGTYNDITLTPQGSIVYQLDGTLPAGKTMNLQPGTIVKLNAGRLTVLGTLNAQGASGAPVVFTSWKDDTYGGDTNGDGNASTPAPADWYGILAQGGTLSLNYAIAQYGGAGALSGCTSEQIPRGMITQSWVQTCYANGVYSAQINITNSTLRYSARPGVQLYGATGISVGAQINNSNIYSNSQYGIYNNVAGTVVDARNNWWGDASGPAPLGSGNAINGRTVCDPTCHTVYDIVLVNPWLPAPVSITNTLPAGSSVIASYNASPSVAWSGWVAEPINVVFGNYLYQHSDLAFPSRGLGFDFKRTYNSNVSDVGSLGLGWTQAYNITATQTTTETVLVRRGDGRLDQYVGSGASFTPPPGSHDQLAKVGSTYVLTQTDQTVLTFDTLGRLATLKDKNGNVTSMGYSGSNLVSVTQPDGRVVSLTYSGSLLTGLSDPAGRAVSFGYTGSLLTSVTDTRGSVTIYAYDGQNRLQSITDANGHTFVNNTYNTDGRVVEQRDAKNNLTTFNYNPSNNQTIVLDPLGHPVTYTYDSAFRITNERDALGYEVATQWDSDNNRSQVTDKNGNITRYTYDSRGNLLTKVDVVGAMTMTYDARNNLLTLTDALSHTTRFAYNSSSNPTVITDTLGYTTTMVYYADAPRNGLLASRKDARGNTTRYDYDSYGNGTVLTDAVSSVSRATYDLVGRKLTDVNARGYTTFYAYDAADHLLAITDTLGNSTVYTYDVVGNRVAERDALGRVVLYGFDAKDRLAVVTNTLGFTTTYTYDANNNQLNTTDALGHTTSYTYDPLNRRATQTDALGMVTNYQYDANGNVTRITDPLSHATNYTFDALNRPAVVTDPLGHAITTTYDAVGNVLAVTDSNNNTTHNIYDALNRLVNVQDALGSVITYTYDAVGNRTGLTDANGHATAYGYDAVNRLTTITDPLLHATTYGYDTAGNRTGSVDANGAVMTNTYDALNRLVNVQYGSGNSVAYAYDAVGNRLTMTDTTGVTSYQYDGLNRPLTITAPGGVVTYAYNAKNRLAVTTLAGATFYTYDAADHLKTVTDWASRTVTYTYDNAGHQTGIAYPNGVTTLNTYDNANRLTNILTSRSGTTLAVFTYTLDAVGNRLTMIDSSGTTAYTYDSLHRLQSVTYPAGSPATVNYNYDPMGNRLTKTEGSTVTAYIYNAADQLMSMVTSGITTTLIWDNKGQLLTKGTQTFSWDDLGRMTGLTSGGTTAAYVYNGDGVRVGKTVNGTATTYLQDLAGGLPVILRETTSGNSTNYIYGTDLLTSIGPGGTPTFYHTDGLGSTRLLTNLSGATTDSYTYDAFGTTRTHTGSNAQPFTYTGEQADPEAGLVFLRARYYDPEVGRFTRRDTYPSLSREPQTLNHYTYVQNNPIRITDPTGQAWYDALDASKNGLNQFLWDNVVSKIPFVRGSIDTASGMDQYSENMRASYELIPSNALDVTDEAEREYNYRTKQAMLGLEKGLSSAANTAMKAPCTSMNIDCGLGSFMPDLIPSPIKDIYGIHKNPLEWAAGKLKDAAIEPIYDIPSLAIHKQFSAYRETSPAYSGWGGSHYAGGGYGGGGGGNWGGPPSSGK